MTRCAHANCYCELNDASTMDRFCSPYCANADAPEPDDAADSACACQHAGCGVSDAPGDGRDRSVPIAMGGGPGAP